MVGKRRTTRRRPDIRSSSGETTHNPALIPQEAAGSTPTYPPIAASVGSKEPAHARNPHRSPLTR
jgi:hypothetical protein